MDHLKSTDRLLKLITLLQGNSERLTVQKLAERFGVTKRTIYRDLNKLATLEIPVTHDVFEGYGIKKEYTIPPLMFSSKELATLIVGLNFVKSQADKQLCYDAEAVEDKIRQVLPGPLKLFMDSLSERTIVDPFLHFGVEKVDGGNWYQISSAIAGRKRIEFDYLAERSSTTGFKKTDSARNDRENKYNLKRIVDPYMIVFYKDHWNLIGFSHKRKEVRNYILNRIQNLYIREDQYKEIIDFPIEAILFRSDKRAYQIVVEVDEKADRQFKANLPTKIVKKNEIKPNKFRYQFTFDNLDYMNRWLLQFAKDVRVIRPKVLNEKREELLRELLKSNNS